MAERIPDWLGRQAVGRAEAVAVENGSVQLTYRLLRQQALLAAALLSRQGASPGDRVAVLVQQGYAYTICVHALMQFGAVLVPINRRLTAPEVAWQLKDAGVHLLVHDEGQHDAARDIVAAAKTLDWSVARVPYEDVAGEDSVDTAPHPGRTRVNLDDVHAVIYTSGTTGQPKGTLITYGNHWWGAIGSVLALGLRAGDRWLSPMPLFHVGGLAVLMRSVIYGTTAVLQDSFDPATANAAVDSGAIDLISLAPTMLQRMLAERSGPYPARFRSVLLGGSAAPAPLLEQCRALGIPVAASYGLTEANSQVATLEARDALRKVGSSGRPLLPTEVEIRVGGRVALPNEEGEIVVRGPTVTPGYLNRSDATSAVLVDGWLSTGDVGCLDEEGYLYVLDRRSDLIVSGAENVYPAEVESILMGHDAVLDACVVGMPDVHWGQVPVAYLVLNPNETVPTDDELRAFCRARVAAYKIPKTFKWASQLPRNASGKLLRKAVRGWLEA